MNDTIVTQTPADRKHSTREATIANIFAAKERHDRRLEAARERTARENPELAGDILWI